MQGKLGQLRTRQDRDSMIFCHTNKIQLQKKSSTIVKCLPINRGVIWKDKSVIKGRDLSPYWTNSHKELSSLLWLPTKTDLQGLDSSYLSIWLNKTVGKSWFSTKLICHQRQNLLKTYLQSCMSSPVDLTGLGTTLVKSRKIRIYPNKEQRVILKKWLGVSRFVYNKTVSYLSQPDTQANFFKVKKIILNELPDWCSLVPYQIKNISVKEACVSVSKAKVSFIKTGKLSKVKFKSKKNKINSIFIPKSSITTKGVYHTILKELFLTEKLPSNIKDGRLSLDYNRWFLIIPYETKILKSENQGRVASLDFGVRNFITFYSPNSCGFLGIDSNKKIFNLCLRVDNMISRMSKAKARQKRKMKLAKDRLVTKINNMILELHQKSANFLVSNFDALIVPKFEVTQMTNKIRRKIKSKSVRQMLSLRFYQFREFLKFKCKENSKLFIEVSEAYTSKTASWTGEVIPNLGGRKTIRSNGVVVDRDINGARGIFLRSLVDSPLFNKNLNELLLLNSNIY